MLAVRQRFEDPVDVDAEPPELAGEEGAERDEDQAATN